MITIIHRLLLAGCLAHISLSLSATSLYSETREAQIPNRFIDSAKYLREVDQAEKLRQKRRLSEEGFVAMSKEPNTIVLDARSAASFKQMHISGAINLNFSDFTEDRLNKIIPSKATKVLIYCNNNIENEPEAFPTKAGAAALNLSTFTALYTYGYKNVYELGPVVDPKTSIIKFKKSVAD